MITHLWEASYVKRSKMWMTKILVFLHNCAPAHWLVFAAATCQARYCGASTPFLLFWAYVMPRMNNCLKGRFVKQALEEQVA
jgi:hypothetical protein